MAVRSEILTGLTLPSSSTSTSTLRTAERSFKTSPFNGGGAFKVSRIKHAPSNISMRSRQRGNALVARMSLFDRFARVAKSYANALISTFEDPEKILEQTVLEMTDDLTKMRQATAQVLASQKQLEKKYKAAQQASEEW